MARAAAILLLAGLAQAGTELFEVESDLWPDGAEYSFDKPAAEVHLLLAFKSGLCTKGERDTAALASAHFVVEYNDADRKTCYWNRFRPFPFDADVNPEWYGDAEAPGLFVTEGASAEATERVIVLRFPRVNRWRVRVTPLYGDDEYVRRGATLVQVAELRDSKARPFEELDPLLPWEEVEVRAEAEETQEAEPPPEEAVEEEPVAATAVESVGRGAVRAIRSGAVPKAGVWRAENHAAQRRASRNRGPYRPPPLPAPIPFPKPGGGARAIPPWGTLQPLWAPPRAKPQRARPSVWRAP